MKKRKLNYRFHNPNTAEVTADYLLKVLVEANMEKVEKVICQDADRVPKKAECVGQIVRAECEHKR